METALRKIGNSTGMVLPRAVLNATGLSLGAKVAIAVEGERIILTPLANGIRAGWGLAAAEVAGQADTEADDWQRVPGPDHADLKW